MLRLNLLLFFFSGCFMLNAQEKLSDIAAEDLQNSLKAKAESIQTMSGKFTQTKELSFLKEAAKSQGVFFYKAPKNLKWVYQSPEEYSLLFSAEKLTIEENGKIKEIETSSNELLAKLSSLIAKSINGAMLTDANFDVNYVKQEKYILANLIPVEDDLKDFITELKLYINPKNFLVEQVKIMENDTDFTLIKLQDIAINKRLKPAVFKQ